MLVLAVSLRAGTAPPLPEATALFHDRAQESGLIFQHDNGLSGEYYLAEIVGSGGALLDYDNDGDLDAYLVQGGTLKPGSASNLSDRLFRNQLEQGELRFVDTTEEAGINATGYGMGVTTGDIDNDGWIDIYVTNFGPNQLWRNRGDGTFEDITEKSGTGDPLWGTSASFLDYDRDGYLDLFVTNYVDFAQDRNWKCYAPNSSRDYCGPQAFNPLPDRLFHNQRDGSFKEVTLEAGLSREYGAGLGVVTADFNLDGWPDIYVANDGMANQMWMNQKDGTFLNEALLAGTALNRMGRAEAGMGVDAGDFDGDGDEDLFVTHLNDETNTIYVNDGSGFFEDRSVETQLATPSVRFTGFGTGWFDYDNDGWLDLLVLNGAVRILEELRQQGDPYPLSQRNQLFRNLGNAKFTETTAQGGAAFEKVEVSRGAAFGDVDNDGDTDVLLVNNRGPAGLLINLTGNRNSWLGVALQSKTAGPTQGTRLKLELTGGTVMWRRAKSDGSYCSANDPRVLFGLGGSKAVSSLTVYWPRGQKETWSNLEAGRYHHLKEGSAPTPVPTSGQP